MELRILGPVELWIGERRWELGGPKEQSALAILAMSAGRTVSAAALGERIWGDESANRARETLHVLISRLRRRLRNAGLVSPMILTSSAQGYRLDVPASAIDAARFELLVRRAAAAASDDPHQAVDLLREAAALFRGEPLSGISGDWAHATRASLLEQLRAAVLRRIGIELRLGRHDQVIGELTELTAGGAGAADQSAVGMLMTALHNAGRPAEALAAYRRTRERLRDELGLEPQRELRELHQRILQGDPGLAPRPPSASPGARSQTQSQTESQTQTQTQPQPQAVEPRRFTANALEGDPPHFTGRELDLGALLGTIDEDLSRGLTSVCVVDGMAGVGKTTLCVHAAHMLRSRCPGGAIQINLRGHNPHQPPMEAGEALLALLGLIGADTAQLQQVDSLLSCITLWRQHTADRPVLLLLDDAHDAEQVSPLLPAAPGSIVLITSRSRLPELGEAHSHPLDVMPSADSAALFARVAGPERITDDTGQLREIIRLCGNLPVELVVAAGHLRSRPGWRLADLAEKLAYTRVERDDADRFARPSRTAFDFSYNALGREQQQLFRRLGLHPGPRFGLHVAAALGGLPAAQTDGMLDALVIHHLLDEPERRRYRMHDLLRDYANQRARIDEDARARATAIRRMLDYYLYVADNAARLLQPHDERLDVPVQHVPAAFPAISSAAEAQEWFEQEYLNLLASARHALDRKAYHHAARLPHALAQYLDRRGRWKEAVEAHESALRAWYALGDTAGQAGALIDLATALWGTEKLDLARFYAETALTMYRDLGDEAGQAEAHLQLGRVHWRARRPALADQHLRDCAALRTRLRDQRGLGVATYHLGIIAVQFGAPADSLAHFEKALRIAQNTRDAASERNCLNNLGEAYKQLGRYAEAERRYQDALTITRRIGSPHNLAMIAHNLGGVYAHTGDHEAALASYESALATFRQVEDVRNEIGTLVGMSAACRELRRADEAVELLERALALVEPMEDPLLHDEVHYAFGEVHLQQQRFPQALQSYRSALAHARRAAAPAEQARALRRIGDVLAVTRGPGAARQQWRKALDLFEQLRLPEAEQVRELIARTEPRPGSPGRGGAERGGPRHHGGGCDAGGPSSGNESTRRVIDQTGWGV